MFVHGIHECEYMCQCVCACVSVCACVGVCACVSVLLNVISIIRVSVGGRAFPGLEVSTFVLVKDRDSSCEIVLFSEL